MYVYNLKIFQRTMIIRTYFDEIYKYFGLSQINKEELDVNASRTLKYNHNIKNKNNGDFQL